MPGPRVEFVVVAVMFAVCGDGIVVSVLVTVKVTVASAPGASGP